MAEVGGTIAAGEPAALHLLLQRLKFAVQCRSRAAAGQPQVLWQRWSGQPQLQLIAVTPWNRIRWNPIHGEFHAITEIEKARTRAVALCQSACALTDETELILFTPTSR